VSGDFAVLNQRYDQNNHRRLNLNEHLFEYPHDLNDDHDHAHVHDSHHDHDPHGRVQRSCTLVRNINHSKRIMNQQYRSC